MTREPARAPVVVFTFDLDHLPEWRCEFLAEGLQLERPRLPHPHGVEKRIVGRLRKSLESDEWERRFGHLRDQDAFDGSLRPVVSEPD